MPEEKASEAIEMFVFKLDVEGFHYCLTEYSDWKELADIDPELYQMIQDYGKLSGKIEKHLKDKYGMELGNN